MSKRRTRVVSETMSAVSKARWADPAYRAKMHTLCGVQWTPDMLRHLIAMRERGENYLACAREIGVAHCTIGRKCRELGLNTEFRIRKKSARRASAAAPDAREGTTSPPPNFPGRFASGRGLLAAVFVCMNLYHPAKLLCGGPYSEREAQRQYQDTYQQYVWDDGLQGDASKPFFVRPGDAQYDAAKQSLVTP